VTTLGIVLLVVVGVVVLASVARGIAHYRSVMRRDWPKVEQRDGNDDDW
jgi:hypothetical protein